MGLFSIIFALLVDEKMKKSELINASPTGGPRSFLVRKTE
jgi:hypothetical protein